MTLLSWPLVIAMAFTGSASGETKVLALAAFATALSLGTLVLAMRYLMRDARRRDHEALRAERAQERAILTAELQQLREQITAHAEDTTRELDAQFVQMVAQNAIAHAQIAAMCEQISLKLDGMWWGAYTNAAHDLGYAVDGEAKVIDLVSRLGERGTIRLRGRDGA
ncbi:hypothetical protein ABZS66_18965 [Dactylosporangium sp. NPDC005572]|uniref:hypothetical protein n=1 Tax=Dactylosporangium sp. NPDC005572 TaxID=3156889 RepID=UPI00339F1755